MSASAAIARENGKKGGRPKGSTTRVRVEDYFTPKEKKDFFENLKKRAKTDTKIAIYLAEQMTGKSVQPMEGGFTGDLFISFDPAFKQK